MNIEQFLKKAKLRPGMYIGDLKLESMYHFISGFLSSNILSGRADYVDIAFKDQFHDWVKGRLEEEKKIELEKNRNYNTYISKVYQDPEQGLSIFFQLSDAFFDELHSKAYNV